MLRGVPRLARRALSDVPRRIKDGSKGFLELRQETVIPSTSASRLDAHAYSAATFANAKANAGVTLCGIWKTRLGGQINTINSLYHWDSYAERDAVGPDFFERAAESTGLRSVIMVEATDSLKSWGLDGVAGFEPTATLGGPRKDAREPSAWEFRKYQLKLGYTTVPKFLELYGSGINEKLAVSRAAAEDTSRLVTLLYSTNGPLNVVIELWRHDSLANAEASRRSSRLAPTWRRAIEEIATISTSFEVEFLRPLPSSPWQ